MERPFPAYKGDEPYIFVSYAHEDSDVVFPEIQWLKGQGFNLWFDEGISPGSRWSEELASALENANLFLFFATSNSIDSKHCLDEVNLALDTGKHAIAVHLQETELTPGLRLRLSSHQAILKYELSEQDYQSKLLSGLGDHIEDTGNAPQPVTPVASGQRNVLLGFGLVAIAIVIGAVLLKPAPEPPKPIPTKELVTPQPEKSTPPVVEPTVEPSIAVLPFVNMSSDPEQEYFSDGISEDLINRLVKQSRIKVIARTSSFQFRGENKDIRKIASILDVTHIVEGSVRKVGNRIRVNAQLIDSRDGSHVWSDKYDRELTDVFAVQDEVTSAILESLKVHLGSSSHRSRLPQNMEAYDTMLQGRQFIRQRKFAQAKESLEKAVSLAPDYAPPHALLARLIDRLRVGEGVLPQEAIPLMRSHTNQALKLDPTSLDALTMAADNYFWLDGDYQKGLDEIGTLLEMYPNDIDLLSLFRVCS